MNISGFNKKRERPQRMGTVSARNIKDLVATSGAETVTLTGSGALAQLIAKKAQGLKPTFANRARPGIKTRPVSVKPQPAQKTPGFPV